MCSFDFFSTFCLSDVFKRSCFLHSACRGQPFQREVRKEIKLTGSRGPSYFTSKASDNTTIYSMPKYLNNVVTQFLCYEESNSNQTYFNVRASYKFDSHKIDTEKNNLCSSEIFETMP